MITAAPKPAGRGNEPRPTPVADSARDAGLPLHEVETVKAGSGAHALASGAPDLLVVVAYGEILPEAVLALPAIAPVNLHFSLLPELRGASPVQTALLEGRVGTGVTTILMDRGDGYRSGDPPAGGAIEPGDDAGSLGDRLASIGAEVLVETVDLFANGEVEPRPQDEAAATFTKLLGAEDRILRWGEPARDLVNRTRAMAPEPGATTRFRGEDLKIFRAEAVPAVGEPGTIVDASKQGFVVATGEDGFRAIEVAPAGRRRMGASDFVNGYRPAVGERLG